MAPLQLQIYNMLMHPMFCRLVGFGSSVVGLLCYALSSSFKHLFGEWNLLKIFLYILLSFIIGGIMLFAKKQNLSKSYMLKGHVGFLVLMLTSVYSFFYDKAVNGKPDILSLISLAAFALMSMCMSRQVNFGFEVDLLYFFLGCLTVQLMKINLMLAFVGAAFSYSFIILRSSLESQPETGTITVSDHIAVDIDTTNRVKTVVDADSGFSSDYSNHPQQLQLLHRRKVDGENEGISAKRELQLKRPRPPPLEVIKKSQKIKKPPLPPLEPREQRQQQPLILYSASPKVINVAVSDFVTIVQRLTGLSSDDESLARSGDISPAASLASIEKRSPSEK